MASLAELFQQLSLCDDKIAILTQIRTVISSASNDDLWSVVSSLSLAGIYENIDSDDSDQLELCCAILDRLFGALDINVLLANFSAELVLGLSQNAPSVNEISLNQVARVANTNAQKLAGYTEVIQRVASLIGCENGNIASKACSIFVSLGRCSEGLELIFHNQVLPQLTELLSKSDSIRYRVYEMFVDIAVLSQEGLLRCSQTSFLQSLVNEMHKNDVMLQLNCLELLAKLSLYDHGFQYLDSVGAVRAVEELLVASEEDEVSAGLLMPGIFKFFGGICYVRPKVMCAQLECFVRKMFEAVFSSSEGGTDMTDVALESVGLIGSTPDGKMALEKYHDSMAKTCRVLGQLLDNAPSYRRSRVLSVICQLIHLEVASQNSELLALTKEWFDHLLESDPLKKILVVAKQPFAELHLPGLEVIKCLAQLPWGQDYLNSQPGFEEYLLDRSTEKSKEGMEKKYEIVKTLANSPTTSGIFSSESLLRLKTFEMQGPFYAPMQTVVAFDSN